MSFQFQVNQIHRLKSAKLVLLEGVLLEGAILTGALAGLEQDGQRMSFTVKGVAIPGTKALGTKELTLSVSSYEPAMQNMEAGCVIAG